jgi:hypothetical protein
MEVKTRKVCVEPIIFIEYNPKKKRYVGSLEVNTDCLGYDAIRNVLVEGTTRLNTFAKLEESISALEKVLYVERIVKQRKKCA